MIKFPHFAIRCPKCNTYGHILPMHPALDPPNFKIWSEKGLTHIQCGKCKYEEVIDWNHKTPDWEGTAPAFYIKGEVDEQGRPIWRGESRFVPI